MIYKIKASSRKKSVSGKVQSFLDFACDASFPFHGFEAEWT